MAAAGHRMRSVAAFERPRLGVEEEGVESMKKLDSTDWCLHVAFLRVLGRRSIACKSGLGSGRRCFFQQRMCIFVQGSLTLFFLKKGIFNLKCDLVLLCDQTRTSPAGGEGMWSCTTMSPAVVL